MRQAQLSEQTNGLCAGSWKEPMGLSRCPYCRVSMQVKKNGTLVKHFPGKPCARGAPSETPCIMWLFGTGFPKSRNQKDEWEGWGTALKPAYEPVVIARKPMGCSVAENLDRHRTGAINIDDCRIGEGKGGTRDGEHSAERNYRDRGATHFTGLPGPRGGDGRGRWPSNVILDQEAAELLDEQSGLLLSGANPIRRGSDGASRDVFGEFKGQEEVRSNRGKERGGASRFFYVAKASRKERNQGLEGLDERPILWSSGEQNAGSFQTNGTTKVQRNHHPTVKPVALMRYLCRLVVPPGGIVLDPMMGSGTTGIAALQEGFRFLGFDRDADYVEIARRRILHHFPHLGVEQVAL